MLNLIMIIGKNNGSEIIYSKNHEIIVQSSSLSSLQVVLEIGKQFYRPAFATMELIGKLNGYHQKVPFMIESNRLLLFPTTGLKDKKCCWINYYSVKKSKRLNYGTEISFHDYSIIKCVDINFKYYLPIDSRTIFNQMYRCKVVHEQYLKNK